MSRTETAGALKHIHRLIVTCADLPPVVGARTPTALAKDAQSRLLWRYPPRRLEAEALRDAILVVSGKLDLTMGGPGFDLFEPNTNYVKVYTPKKEFGPAECRRMIYQNKPRMQLDDTFGAFDCPDARPDRPEAERLDHAAPGAEPAQQPVRAPAGGVLRRARRDGGRRRTPRRR